MAHFSLMMNVTCSQGGAPSSHKATCSNPFVDRFYSFLKRTWISAVRNMPEKNTEPKIPLSKLVRKEKDNTDYKISITFG